MMKKLLSLVLAMMLLLSVIPAQAAQPRAVALDTMPNRITELTELPVTPEVPALTTEFDAANSRYVVQMTNGEYLGTDANMDVHTSNGRVQGVYNAENDCWYINLDPATAAGTNLTEISIYGKTSATQYTNMYMVQFETGEIHAQCSVATEDGAVFYNYGNGWNLGFEPQHYVTDVTTANGEYELEFNFDASGIINGYSYTDPEAGVEYSFDRDGLYNMTWSYSDGTWWHSYTWDKGYGWVDWSQENPYLDEAPEGAPDPESIKPLLGINNNVNNTSTLAMTNMPNNVSEIVDVGSAPEAPKFDVQYDETTGLLTIKATDAQGNPADGINLVDKNWNYTSVPEFDPATGTAVIDLAAAGLTLEDIQQISGWKDTDIYDTNGSSVWPKTDNFNYDMATGDVTFTIYQLTEAGIVNFTKWGENDAYASSMEITINNGDGEQNVTLYLQNDGTVTSYQQEFSDYTVNFDAEGLRNLYLHGENAQWSREDGWYTWQYNAETGSNERVPAEKPEGAPDPESIKAPLGAPVPVEPTEPKATWYPNNTVCVAGLYLKDTVKNLTNKWYNVVPVDISKDGSQTYTLVASGMYVIGRATVTVKGDDVTVTYKYPQGYIEPQSETLAWFTDIDQITTEYLNNPTGNARFGRKVSKANDLNGQDIALLFICNRVTYRQPYYRDGGSLTRYWPNSSYNTGYVKYLKNLLDAME